MTRAAHPVSRRLAARFVSSFTALALVGTTALAGPANPNHRFERIGYSVSDVAATLSMPTLGRSLVLEHDGSFFLTTGDRLVTDQIYHVNVSQTFAGDGLLDATWDLAAPGQILFITYIQPSPRKLAVARLELDMDKVISFDVLYSVTIAPAANSNLGGGIAMGADRKLYVGIGDLGTSTNAQRPTTLAGKIFRLNSDLPGGIPSDNPSPTSPVWSTGVRNPIRMVTNPATGATYFLDVAPAGGVDEVNLIMATSTNYFWDRGTGRQAATGYTDPISPNSWTGVSPNGLVVNDGANFGTGAVGDLFITTASGQIRELHPNGTAIASETTPVPFTPASGEPAAWGGSALHSDGYLYVTDPGGDTWRLRNDASDMEEPSDDLSIEPMLVKKLSGGQLQFSVERETALADYGLYVGDLGLSLQNIRTNWYTHALITTDLHAVDANRTDALSRFNITPTTPPTTFADGRRAWYYLASGVNARMETGLGYNSRSLPRPGGNQTFGCPVPSGLSVGPEIGQAAPEFTLAQGVMGEISPGVYNYIGPGNFFGDWDCDVIYMDMSMEWCNPCRAQASTANALFESYAGRPFMLIHVIPEDVSGNPAYLAVAERWTRDFGLTFPVFPDDNYRVWGLYDDSGAIPQSILIDKNGVIVQHWTGLQSDATLRAAIDRELAR